MKILSHRGYWKIPEEKNNAVAFKRSFTLGYGTETDIRDYGGELVISHDMPDGNEITLEAMLSMAAKESGQLTLALNIKADGLARALEKRLAAYPALDCFVFDMAIPDMRAYFSAPIPVFTRMSEVEKTPVWLEQSAGVWLDGFESEWYDNALIEQLLEAGKRVCIVSSELHKRNRSALWQRLIPLKEQENLMLCTDMPEEATAFFGI